VRRSPLFVVFITIFIDLVSFGIVVPLLPFYAQTFGASGITIGLLLSVFSLMNFIASPIWGRFSDKYGRRPILIGTIFCNIIAYILFSTSSSLWMLFAARILSGLAAGNISAAQAYVSDVTAVENRAQGMGMVGAAFGLGFIFGPMIGGVFSHESFGAMRYALPGYIAAGLCSVNLVSAYFFLPESLKPELRNDTHKIKLLNLRALVHALRTPNLSLVIVLFFLVVVAFSSIYTSFPLFVMEKPFNMSSSGMGYFFMEIGVFSVIIQGGLIGRLTGFFGERKLVLIGGVLLTIGFLGFPISSWLPTWNLICLIIATACISIGSSCLTPTIMSLTSQLADPSEQGSILGVTQSFASLARMIGPAVGGFAYDLAGHRSPYYFAFATMLVAMVLIVMLQKRGEPAGIGTKEE
jgi:DHA1 family tetracycline resistance protein-like MFS transporter